MLSVNWMRSPCRCLRVYKRWHSSYHRLKCQEPRALLLIASTHPMCCQNYVVLGRERSVAATTDLMLCKLPRRFLQKTRQLQVPWPEQQKDTLIYFNTYYGVEIENEVVLGSTRWLCSQHLECRATTASYESSNLWRREICTVSYGVDDSSKISSLVPAHEENAQQTSRPNIDVIHMHAHACMTSNLQYAL